MNTWTSYHKITKDSPPSSLLLEALKDVSNKDGALDLGAGGLKDSKFLLDSGFEKVVAVDSTLPPQLIEDLRFHFNQSNFFNFDYPAGEFDLINAQYAIPFNGRENFNALWSKIMQSLKVGGIFTGQLFGLRDEWNNTDKDIIFHSASEVQTLTDGMEIIKNQEREWDGTLANGQPKHWHIFNLILRRVV